MNICKSKKKHENTVSFVLTCPVLCCEVGYYQLFQTYACRLFWPEVNQETACQIYS